MYSSGWPAQAFLDRLRYRMTESGYPSIVTHNIVGMALIISLVKANRLIWISWRSVNIGLQIIYGTIGLGEGVTRIHEAVI